MSFNQKYSITSCFRGKPLPLLKYVYDLKNPNEQQKQSQTPTSTQNNQQEIIQKYLCLMALTCFLLGESRFPSSFLQTNRNFLNRTICGSTAYTYWILLIWFRYFLQMRKNIYFHFQRRKKKPQLKYVHKKSYLSCLPWKFGNIIICFFTIKWIARDNKDPLVELQYSFHQAKRKENSKAPFSKITA